MSEMNPDVEALNRLFEKVYEKDWITIYAVGE